MMDYLAGALLLTGTALALIAGIGLQRFPDVFSRMHAATKPATLGLVLTLTGVAFALGDLAAVTKLGVVIVLQFITAPIGAHLIGRSSYVAGAEMSPDTQVDPAVSEALGRATGTTRDDST